RARPRPPARLPLQCHRASHRCLDGPADRGRLPGRLRPVLPPPRSRLGLRSRVRQHVEGMGVGEVLTAPHSPWQNPFAERLIGSIRRECLNHVLSLANGTCAAPWLATSRTITGRVLTSRWTRMHPTAGQLSGRNSAASSRFAKSVAYTIATSDGRPVHALSVRHAWADHPNEVEFMVGW